MMFADPVFEIDEEGTPYWVCSRNGQDASDSSAVRTFKGAVLVDAITGESQYYEDVPNWVDQLSTLPI